ncbi:MAG: NAD(P)/FAD-dependent oxidoreductase [Archaeoglobaceae archaeon]
MIQIFGAGVAGTYLYHLFEQNGYKANIFDVRSSVDCRCAWGIIYSEAKELYSRIGVDIDDYLLSKPECVVVNGVVLKNKNIVTFDKKKLLRDLWVDFKKIENPELIIDATGTSRAFLPPIKQDRLFPTIQYLEKQKIEENIYILAKNTGYSWAFPLGNNMWHVGAGALSLEDANELVRKLREKYGFKSCEAECSCLAKIRMLPPSKCRPFIYQNVCGVGEAIGCVSGAGEGNVPALISSKVLFGCIERNKLGEYENCIVKELEWLEVEQKFVEAMLNKKRFSMLRLLPKIVKFERERTVEHSVETIRSILGI